MKTLRDIVYLTDVKEYEDHFEVVMLLPGLTKEDMAGVNIYVKQPEIMFEIKKEQHVNVENKEETVKDFIYRHKEIPSNSHMTRVLHLEGMTGDAKNIKAVLENGILTVSIPKKTKDEVDKEKVAVEFI